MAVEVWVSRGRWNVDGSETWIGNQESQLKQTYRQSSCENNLSLPFLSLNPQIPSVTVAPSKLPSCSIIFPTVLSLKVNQLLHRRPYPAYRSLTHQSWALFQQSTTPKRTPLATKTPRSEPAPRTQARKGRTAMALVCACGP